MDIRDIFLWIHSLVRFAILLVALIGIVKTIANMARQAGGDSADRALGSSFLGLYDLQVLLGLLIILFGGLTQIIHPVVMFVGVAIAHALQSMGKRALGNRWNAIRLAFYIVPLLVILVGLASISRLPY